MRIQGRTLLAFLLLLPACATLPPGGDLPPAASGPEALRRARHYLSTRPDWNIDCSGFVSACYSSRRMDDSLDQQDNPNRTLAIYRFLRKEGEERKDPSGIRPGDILIFHYTYDANHDNAIDSEDVYTHSGIAESCRDGLLVYIDASKGRKPPRLRRRSFSFKAGGKNERVATDPVSGRVIRHKDTYAAAFGFPSP